MKKGGKSSGCKAVRLMKKEQRGRTAVDHPFNRYQGKRIGGRNKR